MPLKPDDQNGMTLVEIMVALAISAVVTLIVVNVYSNFQQSKSLLDGQAELEDYKLIIRTNLRCKETLAAIGTCAAGKKVRILGPAGHPKLSTLIPATGKKIKNYTLTAACTDSTGKEWDITYVDTKTGNPAKPLFVPPLGCL